jgi:hypothetical protein
MAPSPNSNLTVSTVYGRGVLAVFAATVILAVITAVGCDEYFAVHNVTVSMIPPTVFGVVMWLWWGLVACGMWIVARRYPGSLRFSTRTISLQLCFGGLISYIHLEAVQLTFRANSLWPAWRMAYASHHYVTLPHFGINLLTYAFLLAISAVLHVQSQRQLDALRTAELERQLSQAQLRALQMQMEPHLLFNTLNTITSLIAQQKNAEASTVLAHLETMLRTTLQQQSPDKIVFVEELRVIESYLAIQQVRFANRLQVRIEVSTEALEGLIPRFLLQPIVENAIKHGIAPMEAGGWVETEVKRIGNTLWMQVRDNGRGSVAPPAQNLGIGIQNIRERLMYLYPNAHEFAIGASPAGGYQVTIQIPYEQGQPVDGRC